MILSAEFENLERDVWRSTFLSVGVIALLYIGVATAVVGTSTYAGTAVARVASVITSATNEAAAPTLACIAFPSRLATANAYVAATSRLGYGLARDGA